MPAGTTPPSCSFPQFLCFNSCNILQPNRLHVCLSTERQASLGKTAAYMFCRCSISTGQMDLKCGIFSLEEFKPISNIVWLPKLHYVSIIDVFYSLVSHKIFLLRDFLNTHTHRQTQVNNLNFMYDFGIYNQIFPYVTECSVTLPENWLQKSKGRDKDALSTFYSKGSYKYSGPDISDFPIVSRTHLARTNHLRYSFPTSFLVSTKSTGES